MRVLLAGKAIKADHLGREIGDWMGKVIEDETPVVDEVALAQDLKKIISQSYKAALQMIYYRIVGNTYSATDGKTPRVLRIIQTEGRKYMPGGDSNLRIFAHGSNEDNGRSNRGAGILLGIGKKIRRAIADGIEPDLRRDMFLSWKPLGVRYMKYQKPPTTSTLYFKRTGALQDEMRSVLKKLEDHSDEFFKIYTGGRNAQDIINQGRKRKVYRDKKGRFTRTHLQIELMPKWRSLLPGMMGENISDTGGGVAFESAIGFSESAVAKLGGRKGTHRALIKPVFTYYTLYEAPRLVANALRSNTK